ncbi:MAG: hypothetical protein LBU08_04295 [Tannerellaceae bacterium]|jgi:hypothetical protein|nr:hypothetical protein [Tannerellaceae bacterium]
MNPGKEKAVMLGLTLILLAATGGEAAAGQGGARTWYVKPKVFEASDVLSPADSWSSAIRLWEAIERAASGDEILLQVGDYVESSPPPTHPYYLIKEKDLSLRGGYAGTDDNILSLTQSTTLYPPAGGRIMIICGGNVTLQNLSLRGGDAGKSPDYPAQGAGLLVYGGTTVTLEDIHFMENQNLSPQGQGGGLACLGGTADKYTYITFKRRNTFSGNVATMGSGSGQGGAIYAVGFSDLRMEGVLHFIDNTASMLDAGQGGAIFAEIPLFSVQADTFVLDHNFASRGGDGQGGALYVGGKYAAIIDANYILMADNVATSSSQGHGKGGACFVAGWLVLRKGEIRGNVAVLEGIKAKEKEAFGGAFFVKTGAKLDILTADIFGNTLARQLDKLSSGGAIYREDFTSLTLGNGVRIHDNHQPQVFPDPVWTITLPTLHPTVQSDVEPGSYAVLQGRSFSLHPKTSQEGNLFSLSGSGGVTFFPDARGVFTIMPGSDLTLSLISPQSITLSDTRRNTASAVEAGTEITLHTVVSPSDASFQSPTWAILPTGSATFADNDVHGTQRKVRAGLAGSVANIRAYMEEFPEAAASYTLTSASEYIRKLTLFDGNGQHVAVLKNATEFDLYAVQEPSDAPVTLLSWTISPVDAAQFLTPLENLHRKVRILRTDKTPIKITASTVDGSNLSATYTLAATQVPVTGLQLLNDQGYSSSTINANDVLRLTAVITPALVTQGELQWSILSSSAGHAYFIPAPDPSGEIRWLAPNVANVRFQVKVESTDGSGRFALHDISVKPVPLSQLSLVDGSGTQSAILHHQQTLTLYPQLGPEETSDRTLTWNITPSGAAEFTDVYGATLTTSVPRTVRALRAENAVKVSISAGLLTDSFTLRILPIPLDSLVVSNLVNLRQTVAEKGEEVVLKVEFFPTEATEKTIAWEVYPPGAAEILSSSSAGCTCRILVSNQDIAVTAFTFDGSNLHSSHLIRVKPKVVTKLLLEDLYGQKASTIPYKDSMRLKASFYPEDADAEAYQWEISPSDAFVFTDNKPSAGIRTVKAIAPGATGTVKLTSGDRQALYQISSGEYIPVSHLAIERALAGDSCNRNEVFVLTAVLFPENATERTVQWEISPPEAAAFLPGGDPGAYARSLEVKQANTDFTVTVHADGGQKSSSRTFHVRPLLVTALNILGAPSPPKILYVGEQIPLTAEFFPSDATKPELRWSVLPAGAAEIIPGESETACTVTILQADKEITVTVTANDGSLKSNHCLLTANPIPLTGLSLMDGNGNSSSSVNAGQMIELIPTFSPANASDKELVWSLSNDNASFIIPPPPASSWIRYLSATKPFSAVTVTVAAKTNPLLTASYTLTIRPQLITSLQLLNGQGDSESTLDQQQEISLTAEIQPLEGSLHTLYWSIAPKGVLEFTDNQLQASTRGLRALRPGASAIVTASAQDGSGRYATHIVYVNPLVLRSLTLKDPQGNSSSEGEVDQSVVLSLAHSPQEVELPALQWSVSPADAATLTSPSDNPLQRILTPTRSNVTVHVIVSAPDHAVADAIYTHKVRLIPVTSLSLTSVGNVSSILVGENITLQAMISPLWASIRTLNWSVSPQSAAIFTDNASAGSLSRTLTALEGQRTVYVTVTATDGSPVYTTFEFTTLSPPPPDPPASLSPSSPSSPEAPAVRYSDDGSLHLLNLSGARCRLFDVTGRTLDIFTPHSPDENYIPPPPPPPYPASTSFPPSSTMVVHRLSGCCYAEGERVKQS